jgi:hypothetical protein
MYFGTLNRTAMNLISIGDLSAKAIRRRQTSLAHCA